MSAASNAPSSAIPRACVIGWPVAHSRSPLIHGFWLRAYGIEGAYDRQAVEPGALETFLRAMPERGYVGANATVPHKEALLALAAEASEAARAIGAANTLWFENGRPHVTNTDAYGFMTHLARTAPGWDARDAPALVLGAGGAARAIVYGLLEAGVEEVRLVNRTLARAEALARDFGPRVRVHTWAERERALAGCTLLVNTTTLGMTGAPPLEIALDALAPEAVVADIVYVPLETPLLAAARRAGHRPVDGLGMLLHQAVPGFERWFGVRPEVTEALRARVVADIEAGESRGAGESDGAEA